MKLPAKEQEIASDSRHADLATGYGKTMNSSKTLDANEAKQLLTHAQEDVNTRRDLFEYLAARTYNPKTL
jgi:hypothetical protein